METDPILVNADTRLKCAKCGRVYTVATMGTHIGPCQKGNLKVTKDKRAAHQRTYQKKLNNKLSRARSYALGTLKTGVHHRALKALGPRPPPRDGFLDIACHSPFFWDRTELPDFSDAAKEYFFEHIHQYAKKVCSLFVVIVSTHPRR